MAEQLERVAVLGGRGMLGSEVGAVLRAAGHAVRSYDLPECDVTDAASLEAALAGVTAVVNCAAFTQVDAAEGQASRAMAVNRAIASPRMGLAAGYRRTAFIANASERRRVSACVVVVPAGCSTPPPLAYTGSLGISSTAGASQQRCPHPYGHVYGIPYWAILKEICGTS